MIEALDDISDLAWRAQSDDDTQPSAVLRRAGPVITIGPPQHEPWVVSYEAIGRLAGRNVRARVVSAPGEVLEDIARFLRAQAKFLHEIGSDAVPRLLGAYGRGDQVQLLARTDDAFVTWRELIEVHHTTRGPVGVSLALDLAWRYADLFAAFGPAVRLVAEPDEDWQLATTGRAIIDAQPYPSLRHFSVGAAAGILQRDVSLMAPEEVLGEHTDARTLVHWLGGALFWMLAGERPYRGGDRMLERYRSILDDPVPDVRDSRPDVPDSVARLVRKCMAKNAADRFKNPRAVASAIRSNTEVVAVPNGTAMLIRELFPERFRARAALNKAIRALDFERAWSRMSDDGLERIDVG